MDGSFHSRGGHTKLDPVGQISRLAGILALDEPLVQLRAQVLDHVVQQVLLAEDGLQVEVLLVRLDVPRVEVVAARAEDVLDALALVLGVADLVEVTLDGLSATDT